jgi:hypothetical protein
MQFTNCSDYTVGMGNSTDATYLYDYQEEIKYIERSTNLKLNLNAKKLFDSFIDNFARSCRANYPIAHFKEELALLDKNYLSEPTFDYVKDFTFDDGKLYMLGNVRSIRRACDKPQYDLTVQTESRAEGSLLCTFKSKINLILDNGDLLEGTIGVKVCILINF